MGLEDSDPHWETLHPTSIARFCAPETSKSKINIVCTWSRAGDINPADTIFGEHHVTDLEVRPKTKSKGCPITTTCKHPSIVTHNFAKGPAHVPFEVTVRNRLVEAVVEFEFATERPKTFEFIGAESFAWELGAGEDLTIPVIAVIPNAGVHNLQHVRLTVTKEGKKVPYLFPLQWMVKVLGEGQP
jgi:hypothetical protein